MTIILRKGAPKGALLMGRALLGLLLLFSQRFTGCDHQILAFVFDTVLGVNIGAEVPGDDNRCAFLEKLLGDIDILCSVLGEHHCIKEQGRHVLAEVVGDCKAGYFTVLAVKETCIFSEAT